MKDVFAASDVYTVKNLTGNETILMRGAVTETLDPASKPVAGAKNELLQALAWIREYTAPNGSTKGQAFPTRATQVHAPNISSTAVSVRSLSISNRRRQSIPRVRPPGRFGKWDRRDD